jgi:hypothetical protein
MSTSVEPWQPILDVLGGLRAAWPVADWTWDPRFKCVTSSFAASFIPAAREVLTGTVPTEWTAATVVSAPDDVRALSDRYGGLRPGQLLFTGEKVAGMNLFALWWPWGDGSMLSIRIGIANAQRPTELYPLVRSLFGIV